MNYYIADTHFGHANILRHSKRPFGSVEEMDEAVVKNWRNRVNEEDRVYIVGDLFFRHKDPEAVLDLLPGRKVLIEGNHDRTWLRKINGEKYFEDVQLMAEIKDEGRRVILCHYPLMTWFEFGKGTYHVYGHIHDNVDLPYWPLLAQMEKALNAGVDINHFCPVTLDELIENNRTFRHDHPAGRGNIEIQD